MTECRRYDECKEPELHDLTDVERTLAEHFLSEIYAGHGDKHRSSYPPEPVADMIAGDPHYVVCQSAIRDARRLVLAFPDLRLRPGKTGGDDA